MRLTELMVDRTPPSRRGALSVVGLVAAMSTACDLQSKAYAVTTLERAPDLTVAVVDPWLELSLSFNHGTAFSLIPNVGAGRWLLAAVALGVVAWLVRLALTLPTDRRLAFVAIGLVIGGALGNLYGRVLRPEAGVVDFIKVTLPGGHVWPIFNVADILLVVGLPLLVLGLARAGPEPAEAQ